MKAASALLLSLSVTAATLPCHAQESALDSLAKLTSKVQVDSLGGADVDLEKGTFRYKEKVDIRYEGARILADSAVFNQKTGEIKAEGNVNIFRNGVLYSGDTAVYNIRTESITSGNLKSSVVAQGKELYFQSESISTQLVGDDEIEVIDTEKTLLTTHDNANPNWHILADELDIYPDDRIVLKDVTFYAKNVPIMWLPYLSQPLDDELGYTFAPGWDSAWGGYLLNRYGTILGKKQDTLGIFHLDLRSERGVAGGVDFKSLKHRDNPNMKGLQLYYAYDLKPETSRTSRDRTSDDDVPENNRYRANLQHRVYIGGYDETVAIEDAGSSSEYRKRTFTPRNESFYINFDVNKLSDGYFYEDFFPNEFRIDPQPDNNATLVKRFQNSELTLLGRFDINEFFQTDQRVEAAYDVIRRPVLSSLFNYEGSTTYGTMEESPAEGTGARETDLTDTIGYNRFDTYHQISRPFKAFNFLSIVPRAGARYTNYSSPTGSTTGGDRLLGHFGFDTSFKATRDYDSAASKALGLDGVRHVFQPYLNYSFIEGNDVSDDFTGIDRLVASTRPRPLDPSQFTAVDSLTSWNIVRLGMFNRLLTHRNSGSYEWLSFNTYFDTFLNDPELDRDFSNLYQDIAWRPLPWLQFRLDSQFPIFGGADAFTEVNSRVVYMPTPNAEISLGHRFLDDHPFLSNSNQLTFDYFQRLYDNWGFSIRQRWELDTSNLDTQQYSLHRDLTSWTASLGAVIRDNGGVDDYGVLFTMTLKEFPQFNIPVNLDPNSASN